jgi:hypothetical protein
VCDEVSFLFVVIRENYDEKLQILRTSEKITLRAINESEKLASGTSTYLLMLAEGRS